ncbi:predicted protein [Lichtheimia corymbifera JMRC:FSU:9682]|uniref:Uncharacterized protein n=1 Tax=Lichtheimia corymbifera JMRC:FSU:9682 TaxID=1263082 RepID=A0A068SAW1_9FUNG|nr:predicted protein [Lichtheimia corymbifera JMRC:FSU:9682]
MYPIPSHDEVQHRKKEDPLHNRISKIGCQHYLRGTMNCSNKETHPHATKVNGWTRGGGSNSWGVELCSWMMMVDRLHKGR